MTQGITWNILRMIGLTPWTQGSLFYFLSPCWLATSWNTRWMNIHKIIRIWTQEAIGYTVSRLSRLFHALQTRRVGGLRSRSASCSDCLAVRATGLIHLTVGSYRDCIRPQNDVFICHLFYFFCKFVEHALLLFFEISGRCMNIANRIYCPVAFDVYYNKSSVSISGYLQNEYCHPSSI